MEGMERREKQSTVTRLAVCVALALAIYFGGERLWTSLKLPFWEKYRPWLEENKIQAIAVVAGVLFAVSLAVFPLKKGEDTPPPPFCPPEEGGPEDFIPCEPC